MLYFDVLISPEKNLTTLRNLQRQWMLQYALFKDDLFLDNMMFKLFVQYRFQSPAGLHCYCSEWEFSGFTLSNLKFGKTFL
jgi:hypothetical protein